MEKTVIKERLVFYKNVYAKYQDAYIALIDGRVKEYTIDDRSLTRFDLKDIQQILDDYEKKIDELQALLDGKKPRKAFAVVPRDW